MHLHASWKYQFLYNQKSSNVGSWSIFEWETNVEFGLYLYGKLPKQVLPRLGASLISLLARSDKKVI